MHFSPVGSADGQPVCRKPAGITKHVSLYTLRHNFGIHMREVGADTNPSDGPIVYLVCYRLPQRFRATCD
jgi:hypothetical protein